jgi:hypothetical protein
MKLQPKTNIADELTLAQRLEQAAKEIVENQAASEGVHVEITPKVIDEIEEYGDRLYDWES